MAEYYLDPNGIGGTPDDGNEGTISSPWETIDGACQQMPAGNRLNIRTSTIATNDLDISQAAFRNLSSGSGVGAETIIQAYQGETVTLAVTIAGRYGMVIPHNLKYVKWKDLIIDGGGISKQLVRMDSNNVNNGWLTWQNCYVKDTDVVGEYSGFQIAGSTDGEGGTIGPLYILDNIIEGCGDFTTDRGYAIYFGGTFNDSVIGGNTFRNIAGAGMQIYDGHIYNGVAADMQRVTVRDNRIYDFGGIGTRNGIYVSNGDAHRIYGNVIYSPNGSGSNFRGIYIGTGGAHHNCVVYHNVVHGAFEIGIYNYQGNNTQIKNNVVLGATTPILNDPSNSGVSISNNVTSGTPSAMFVAPWDGSTKTDVHLQSRDYHILNSGVTSLVDAGVPVGIEFDPDGVVRSQTAPDIGAFELVAAASELWTAALQIPGGTWQNSSITNHTCRFLMLASAWSTSVTTAFKLVFKGRTDASYTIQKVSVVERDGATLNGVDATNQQVTFGGTWAAGGTVPQNGELISDTISLALDESKDYFITFYASGSVGQYRDNTGGATNAWFIAGDDATDIDWGAKSPTATWPHVYSVTRIEEASDPQSPDSAPLIVYSSPYTVVSGDLEQISTTLADINENIVLVTMLSTKVSIFVDHTLATIDEYTGA